MTSSQDRQLEEFSKKKTATLERRLLIENNREAIRCAREKLNIKVSPDSVSQAEITTLVQALISGDSPVLYSVLTDLLNQLNLNQEYLFLVVIYLYFNSVGSIRLADANIAHIESEKISPPLLYSIGHQNSPYENSAEALVVSSLKLRHPIGIFISPHAEQKEIVAFIRKNWKVILLHQRAYGKKKQLRTLPNRNLYKDLIALKEKGVTNRAIADALYKKYPNHNLIYADIPDLHKKAQEALKGEPITLL